MVKPHSREHPVAPADRDRMFVAGCPNLKDKAVFILLAFGGMRVSEVSHVRASWWNGQSIKVPMQQPCDCATCQKRWERKPKSRGYWTPKTRKGARTIPIRAFYRPFLTAFFKASPAGIGVTERTIERWLSEYAERAGLSIKVFPHCLRATLASEFSAAGLSQEFMCSFFGWVKFQTAAAYLNLDSVMSDELSKMGLL